MTLISNKFEYRKLKRVEVDGKRRYDWGEGIPVPSVTTILDATKDKTHIHEWRKRVGEQAATQITTEAAGRGTRMHKYLEDYIGTGVWPSPGSNPYAVQAHKMATRIKDEALLDINEIDNEVADTCADHADVLDDWRWIGLHWRQYQMQPNSPRPQKRVSGNRHRS